MAVDKITAKDIMADKKKKDPCWRGYKKEGTKKKDGKTVPNCVKQSKNDN